MRQTTKIQQITNVVPGEGDFNVNVTIDGQSVTVIAGNNFLQFLAIKFYEWSFFSQGDDAAMWYASLKSQFDLFMIEQGDMFSMIYKALSAEYDPSVNFSRDEQQSHKNTHTVINGKSMTTTFNNYQSSLTHGAVVDDKVTTFESAALRNAAERSNSGTDTNTITGSYTAANSGTDTTTDSGLLADNKRIVKGVSGAAPAENIRAEIDMRMKYDFLDIVLDSFVNRYLFLLA